MHIQLAEDSGATVTDMMMALLRFGMCKESMWSSSDPDLRYQLEPTPDTDQDAEKHQALRCYALSNLAWMRACVSMGFPFAFGFSVPKHFLYETPRTGQLHKPFAHEAFDGGHCVTSYGYDDDRDNGDGTRGAFLVRNSWGESFGLKDIEWNGHKRPGDYWHPYWYFENLLAIDAWTEHQGEA
jgi:hypothetical protein